jgi:tetratricopeptide (TPR) repeat protein
VYRLLAEVELAQERTPAALDYAERARRIAAATGNPEWQGIAERVLAQGHAQAGDITQARQAFEASIVSLRASESQLQLARTHFQFGSLLAGLAGQEGSAREHLQQAAHLFADGGAEKEAAQARLALAALET